MNRWTIKVAKCRLRETKRGVHKTNIEMGGWYSKNSWNKLDEIQASIEKPIRGLHAAVDWLGLEQGADVVII